jgi:putative oxidoreductase
MKCLAIFLCQRKQNCKKKQPSLVLCHMNVENIQGFRLDSGLALLRIGFGLSLAFVHGWQKLGDAAIFFFEGHTWGFVGLVRSLGFPAPAFFALCAALGESLGGLCVACGLLTRISAGAVTMTMAVAVYASVRMGTPIEGASLYAIPFAAFILTGPGRFSLDHLLGTARPVTSLAAQKG